MQHRLSPDQARAPRRGPPRARASHRRHLVARGGPRQPAPRDLHADRARALCRRPLRVAGGRNGPGDRVPPQGQPAHRPHRRTAHRDQAHGRARRLLRRRGLRNRAERGEGALSADGCLADQGRDLHPRRRANQSRRHRDGARQGRADRRRANLRGDGRHRLRAQERRGLGRLHGARHHRLRDRRQLRRHLGARDRADGGRQRAALCRRAHVRGDRPDRGALSRCADRSRHRRLHLCEGGRGPAPRRLLRARGQAAAAGQDAGTAPSSWNCRRTGTISSCR